MTPPAPLRPQRPAGTRPALLSHLRFLLRQWLYDLRTGLLFRPGLLTLSLGLLGVLLPLVDSHPPVDTWLRDHLGTAWSGEPGAAQALLTTIASSTMTTVSVVYSVLLMALSLASVQFSPRVLGTFLRGRSSQTTLGVFIGTFTYCLLVLRVVRQEPPVVPVLSVLLAVLLALVCLALLIWALHELATSIQVSHVADRIATETEAVLDAVLPPPDAQPPAPMPPIPADALPIAAPTSGYLQLVDQAALVALAESARTIVYIPVLEGEFVVEGEPLAFLHPPASATDELTDEVRGAFDLGPVRTMQQDAEFGVRQIVDVALKAISPAVNDPSTAGTCIDHLARLLVRAGKRGLPSCEILGQDGQLRVARRQPTLTRLLDLAFSQLRQYGSGDMAVALRLVRAMTAVAQVSQRPEDLQRVRHHAELLARAVRPRFDPADVAELDRRLGHLWAVIDERTPTHQAQAVAAA